MRAFLPIVAVLSAFFATGPLNAAESPAASSRRWFDSGKLLATSGVTQIEGAGGGGLAAWALIAGYGTRDSIGLAAHASYVHLSDYDLWSPGLAIGLFDRVELSYARHIFDTRVVGKRLRLGEGFKVDQDIFGAKIKLIGDVVYDQDRWWLPQIAIGMQYKRNDESTRVKLIGARSGDGIDYYISATKLFLAQGVLLNVTLRETRANQFGLLGFGGSKNGGYSTQVESSVAFLISRKLALGGEYRTKPNNLRIAREDDAWTVFAAYFFNKHLAVTAAYTDLGNILFEDNQRGLYLSVQIGI